MGRVGIFLVRASLASLFALFMGSWVIGCATPEKSTLKNRVDKVLDESGENPGLAAKAAEAEAALERVNTRYPIDGIELRLEGGLSPEETASEKMEIQGRVPFQNPFVLSAEKEARVAAAKAKVIELESAQQGWKAEECLVATKQAAHRVLTKYFSLYEEQVNEILAWNASWQSSGAVDELNGARLVVAAKRRLALYRPAAMVMRPDRVGEFMPSLDKPTKNFQKNSETIFNILRTKNFDLAQTKAQKENYEARASAKRKEALPWFDFFGTRYEPAMNQRNAEARRWDAMARKEAFTREETLQESHRLVLESLTALQTFEDAKESFRDLLASADQSEAIALKWKVAQSANPWDVLRLYDEAFLARRVVTQARREAGRHSCDLLDMTTISAHEWPELK